MVANTLRTAGLALAGLALTALPAFADHDRGRREPHSSDRAVEHRSEPARSPEPARPESSRFVSRAEVDRAVPRTVAPRVDDRRYDNRRFDNRVYDNRGYDNRRYGGARYETRRYYSPRIIRPSIVNIVPYRPWVYRYRPAISFYYGYGYYPYSYEMPPAAYLSAQPGRLYGGVRITDAPRDAQVFVDGYYMGVVDDFDGIFQHMNLEAGPHHIEVVEEGFEPIAFDINVQPGQTTTFRAYMQPAQP